MMTEYYQLKMVEISEFDEVNKILLLFIQNQLHLYIFSFEFLFFKLIQDQITFYRIRVTCIQANIMPRKYDNNMKIS